MRKRMDSHWLRLQDKFLSYAKWRLTQGLLPQAVAEVQQQVKDVLKSTSTLKLPVSVSYKCRVYC